MIIPAISQAPDLSFLSEKDGLRTTRWGGIEADPVTLETSVEGIFAGGDVVTGPQTYIDAMGAGRKAAISVDRYLRGEDLREGREAEGPQKGLHPGRHRRGGVSETSTSDQPFPRKGERISTR